MLRDWRGEGTVINMEEMIILHRELITQSTFLHWLLVIAIVVAFLYQNRWFVMSDNERVRRVLDFCSLILLIGLIFLLVYKPLHKQIERIEVIGYFEDFQKKIENRGYEVVERRGDIVVLEREYK